MNVIEIIHVDESGQESGSVYCWGVRDGMRTVQSCLQRGEAVEVKRIQMTEKEFDSLPEYDGEC